MKVLVATNELQGAQSGDYAHTVEGELVIAEVSECDDADRCGCSRGFPGLASSKATTTAMVADLPHLSAADLRIAVADWLDRGGWTDLFRAAADEDDDADEMLDAVVDEHLDAVATICDAFPVGTIIERSGTHVSARSIPFAA